MAAISLTVALACGGGGENEEGEETSLTASGTAAASPGSEPQGKIAYRSNRDGNWEIYVINADGSGETNLTNHPATEFNPAWSPDGSQIVFVSNRDGDPHLFTMDADGSNVKRLTTGGGELSPRWSPDGSQIVYTRSGLMVINADGTDPRVVLESKSAGAGAVCGAGPFPGGWSPDGTRIAYYTASISSEGSQICTIGVDGFGIEVVVSEPVALHAEPAWSPDGRYIAFRSIREGNHDIYVIDLETGEEQRLTDDPGRDVEPGWSPDGEWITFSSSRASSNTDVYIMRRDGSDVRRLNTDTGIDSESVWGP